MTPKNGRKNSENSADSAELTAAKKRRPGRPAGTHSKGGKREHLLDTAMNLFSTRGIGETPLSAIAKEAGVTTAMLHYYFNTREHLLDVLIDERYMPVRASFGGIFEQHPNDPVKALTALTHKFIDSALLYPWFAPLWIREVLSESGLLKRRMDERFGADQKKSAVRWIEKWQRDGRLNPDLQPEFLFISLFGLTLLPVAAMQKRIRKGDDSLNADMLARHVAALLSSGIGTAPVK